MKIGLDFGTTTSTLAFVAPDGQIRTGTTVSSLCAWRNGELLFGEDAHAALRDDSVPAFPIRDMKLNLGNERLRVGPVHLGTADIIAGFMKDLVRRIAGDQVIEEAVIGTPINVTEDHRLALLDAAKLAGFRNTRLIYEPTAALAGAVDPAMLDSDSTVLVVDWGGGTLDLSIVRKTGNALREIAVDGDVYMLGGSRMDAQLLDRMYERHPGLRERVALRDGGSDLLKVEIEYEKRLILDSDDPEAENGEMAPSWLALSEPIVLRGKDVADVAMLTAEEAAKRILRFLSRSHLSIRDITHVLFAGGVCQSDLIRDWVMDSLSGPQQLSTTVPQQLTGYGCARLLKTGFEVQLASHVGVLQSDRSFCTLLPANDETYLGSYRQAEFFVTDATAMEAIFELGLVAPTSGARRMLSSSADGFVSLRTFGLRCQRHEGQLRGLSDVIRLYAGISDALAVTVHAESSATDASTNVSVSGVPMLIRLGG